MGDEAAEPSGAANVKPVDRGVTGRIYDFFDTKVGFALLTFLLTGGLGTLATWLVADFQHTQQVETQSLQARASELTSVHSGIIQSILEREIAAENLMRAFEVGASSDDVADLWKKYEEAVHAETLEASQSHLVITLHTQDGPDPGPAERAYVFWDYLTEVIQPRFTDMHDCMLHMHNAFISADDPLRNRLAKARADLAVCKTKSEWDRNAYKYVIDKATSKVGSVSDWDDFKTCLEDYTYLLDMSARLEARVGQSNRSWSLSDFVPPRRRREDDPLYTQDYFFNHLKSRLSESCGNRDKSYQ